MSQRPELPLRGRRVVVTRPIGQADSLRTALERLGAEVVHVPLIHIQPLAVDTRAWLRAEEADWLAFTSANGITHGWHAAPLSVRARLRANAEVAAVGPATARAARVAGLVVQPLPERFVAESLADLLIRAKARRVTWLRGEEARETLGARLREAGIALQEVIVYRSAPVTVGALPLLGPTDIVTLTSPSAARQFARESGLHGDALVACIGPVTATAAQAAGLRVDATSEPYSVDGLVEAIVRLVQASSTPIAAPAHA